MIISAENAELLAACSAARGEPGKSGLEANERPPERVNRPGVFRVLQLGEFVFLDLDPPEIDGAQ